MDTVLRGAYDILMFNGTETNGTTTVEFIRNLDTGDGRDNPIPKNGTMKLIWVVGPRDSLDGMHYRAGYGTIDIVSWRTSSEEHRNQ